MVGELVAEEIAPRAAKIDREGTHLEDGEAVDGPGDEGGVRRASTRPSCTSSASRASSAASTRRSSSTSSCGEMIARGDVSVMAHFSFHGGMAMAMLAFSVHEGTTDVRRARRAASRRPASPTRSTRSPAARPGAAWTSPSPTPAATWPRCARAPSRTRTGNWFVTGQKIFITSGHGKYHFVIARTEDAKDPNDPFAGLGGLSMFLVQGLRRPARRHAQAPRHARARRGEARPPRLGDRGALVRPRPGRAHRQARRGLQVHARAHEQRPRGRRVREHRPRARRPTAGPGLRRGAALDGQGHRPPRDDRRLPRRDADRRPGHARAGRRRRLPRGDGAEARAPRALLEPAQPDEEDARSTRPRRRHRARSRAASRRSSSTSPPRRRSRSRGATCRSTAASATRASTAPRSCSATRW